MNNLILSTLIESFTNDDGKRGVSSKKYVKTVKIDTIINSSG
jgi:hypothetical protein